MASEAICIKCGNRYQKLPRSTSGKCCSCRKLARQKVASRQRSETAESAFDSQTALDAWYDHDKLECHLCGGRFAGLYAHVRTAHQMSARDYKLRFGIPMTYGLSGRSTRMKQRACAAATIEKTSKHAFSNLKKGRAARGTSRVSWTRYQANEHVVRMTESDAHPSHYEGYVTMTCTSCGDEFDLPATIALSFQCRAKCPACKTL